MREFGCGLKTYTVLVPWLVASEWKSDSPSSPSFCHVFPPSLLLMRPNGFVSPERGAGWPLLYSASRVAEKPM